MDKWLNKICSEIFTKIESNRINSMTFNSLKWFNYNSIKGIQIIQTEENSYFSVGIDFGTLSARALFVNITTGEEVLDLEAPYLHGVLDKTLPDGTPLKEGWALQYPPDYLQSASQCIQSGLKSLNITSEKIISLGIDSTESTIVPIKEDGTPLCILPEFKSNPYSYAFLWKHHAAQKYADILTENAIKRKEPFLPYYGNKISSESMLPKMLQIFIEAPEVFHAIDGFIELSDWIVYQITGNLFRNQCTAGYKALWRKDTGFPSDLFFYSIKSILEGSQNNFPKLIHNHNYDFDSNVLESKLLLSKGPLTQILQKAGEISEKGSEIIQLKPGTTVSIGCGDAHTTVLGAGIITPGKMLLVGGTSGCNLLLSNSL